MTSEQWEQLLAIIDGRQIDPLPTGFIIDSPWLPGWAGMRALDYYSSDSMWFEANLKAIETFPDILFLPGFWSEFGMCTEPSAFGARCRWAPDDMPFAEKIIADVSEIAKLQKPDVRTDGLLPLMLCRLEHYQDRIVEAGHSIRFAVARGPMNIASFLMGTTELLMALRTDAEAIERLLTLITDFTADWLMLQKESFPSIEGVLILDDIVGFIGEADFKQTALPYLTRLFGCLDVPVRFFHNDAQGLVCAPFLQEMGVNLFNFSFEHPLGQMRKLAGDSVTLLGGIPPREVLAQGTPDDVAAAVKTALESLDDTRRVILSCGGGMPPAVPTENIKAFIEAVRSGGAK